MAYINGRKVLFAPKVTIKKIDKEEYAADINAAFEAGRNDTVGANPSCTDFSYFFYTNARIGDINKIKYEDTSGGTNFSFMFNYATEITSIPEFDTSNGTEFKYMFSNCNKLTSIPRLNTSKCADFSYMFDYCEVLTSIPELDTSNGTNFNRMFYCCKKITSIPELDTSNGTNFDSMFYNCGALTSIPELDTSNGTDLELMFGYCTTLKTIGGINLTKATDVTGMFSKCLKLENITINGTIKINNLDISKSTLLTVESLLSIFNALEDKTSDTSTTTWTVKISSTNKAKLTEAQLAIALNKGWVVQ